MARNATPNGSPTYGRYDEGQLSPNIAGPPGGSKREKKRAALRERLMDMMATFSRDHHEHYYAQLIGLQCDMNLIMRADCYSNAPLDDDPEHINNMLQEARREVTRSRPISEEAEPSFLAFAGKYYNKLVEDVNAAMERRDVDLTVAHTFYQESIDEIRRTQQYKTQLAHEEHKILVQTIRERLIQQTMRKKERLIREKEQLDIGDSSALLLNPAQFTIGNPASPGGPQNPRKTRNTRLRPEDREDPLSRKRKAPADEAEYDSPAPNGRSAENRIVTPYKDNKTKAYYTQQEAPLYSISNLFTEKELALNLSNASSDANAWFARAKAVSNGGSAPLAVNGTALDAATTASIDGADGADDAAILPGNASPSHTPAMPVHATRSSQRATALGDLAAVAVATGPFYAVAPAIPFTTSKGNPPHAPTLPSLDPPEVHGDMALYKADLEDPIIAKLAERSTEKHRPLAAADFDTLMSIGMSTAPILNGLNVNGVANAAAIAMQRQESGLGLGVELGGTPMTRERSLGGVSDVGDGISAADFGSARKR